MGAATTVIPYERQTDAGSNRDCGAACLSMVYRSLGKKVEQAEIWPAIAKQNHFGSIASTTHLMAKDALNRGFSAVAFQACHPLQALRLCCEAGVRTILNHRLTHDSPQGHYTVLVDVDLRDVVLHDPLYGPSRHVPHDEAREDEPGDGHHDLLADGRRVEPRPRLRCGRAHRCRSSSGGPRGPSARTT